MIYDFIDHLFISPASKLPLPGKTLSHLLNIWSWSPSFCPWCLKGDIHSRLFEELFTWGDFCRGSWSCASTLVHHNVSLDLWNSLVYHLRVCQAPPPNPLVTAISSLSTRVSNRPPFGYTLIFPPLTGWNLSGILSLELFSFFLQRSPVCRPPFFSSWPSFLSLMSNDSCSIVWGCAGMNGCVHSGVFWLFTHDVSLLL